MTARSPVVGLDELRALAQRTCVITGAGGMLGSAFREILECVTGCTVVAPDRAALDVTDRAAVLALARHAPDVVLHCGGEAHADRCEREPQRCRQSHVDGTANVIALAQRTGAQVVYPQSVFIFDGRELPVSERTTPNPLSEYGRVKWAAERLLVESLPGSLIIRMAGFFGGEARDKNFVGTFTREVFTRLERGERTCRVGDRVWQPSYTRDLASNTLLLVALGRSGCFHMGAHDEATFFEVARACVEDLGLAARMRVDPLPAAERATLEPAPRPFRMVTANRRLAAEGLDRQRPWREALREYLSGAYFQSRARRVDGAPA